MANAGLLLLRNLAFGPDNKTHFVSNPRSLQLLVDAIEQGPDNPRGCAYAASGLWALMYQGEKASHPLHLLLCMAISVAWQLDDSEVDDKIIGLTTHFAIFDRSFG